MHASLTIARYTLLEALRSRWLWLLLLCTLAALALSTLLDALALTESRQLQMAVLAAVLRGSSVFLVLIFVLGSMAREASDKGLQLLLAQAYSRAVYLAGKLLAYAALALLPALLFGSLAALAAPPAQAALWALGLLCECWIMAAFAVLCMLSLQQLPAALALCSGFYLLARSIDTLQLLGHGAQAQAASSAVVARLIDLLALLLPHLDRYPRSEWLVYHTGTLGDLAGLLIQTAIFLLLLVLAALVDLYRKRL